MAASLDRSSPPPPAAADRRPGPPPPSTEGGSEADLPIWERLRSSGGPGAPVVPGASGAPGHAGGARATWSADGPPAGGTPPPPPRPPWRAVRGDGPARLTAATLVSATGALLLLAAAATFLAVSWDSLGLTARVAVVAAGTAGAIVGGARLRRSLPAVGAVVFHLGAFLLPVDALGLALQLDASRAATWIAVGATGLVTLPVAAAVGRSRLLAAGGVAAVPVLATGLGLAGVAPAPLLVALTALVTAAVVPPVVQPVGRDRAGGGSSGREPSGIPARAVAGVAAPVLAVAAVLVPLLVAVGDALAVTGAGTPLRTATTAGWLPATWTDPVAAGAVAVLALVVLVVRRRSARWAGALPIVLVLTTVGLLLPGDAPRLARVLPLPLLLLAVEVVAAALRGDRTLAGAAARVAAVAEVLAALALPAALVTVAAGPWFEAGSGGAAEGDPVLAAVALVAAAAWVVAALRSGGGAAGPRTLASWGAAIAVAAAGVTLLAPAAGLGLLVCAAGLLTLGAVGRGGAGGSVASTAVVALGGTLVLGTWSLADAAGWAETVEGSVVAAAAALVAVTLALRVRCHADAGEGREAAVVLLPVLGGAVLVAGAAAGAAGGVGAGAVVAVVLLLLAATIVDPLPGSWTSHRGDADQRRHGASTLPAVGHTLRVLAALTAILVEPAGQVGLDAAATAAPAALIVALVLGTEVARGRPAWLLVVAGPAAARAVAGLAVIATDSRLVAGVALLCLAVVAGLAAAARSELRAGGVVTALVAGIPAIGLLSPSPRALAWATVLTGAVIVVGGVLAARTPVAHGGGVVATVGIWQLLGIAEVTAVDAWVLAPALQLWLLGLPGRRAGRLSSWTVDVPPLLLVVVPAVLERLAGGGGWHAVLAGVVAVVAVAGGGLGRHGGPLVVGVVAVVAVVLVETLAVVAAVPTWAWLTVGGAVLLGAGAAIERTGGAPVAGARRLVDVLAERFD